MKPPVLVIAEYANERWANGIADAMFVPVAQWLEAAREGIEVVEAEETGV